jgi:hypothetical protein
MDLAKDVMAAEASYLFLYNPENRLLEAVSIKDDLFGHKDGNSRPTIRLCTEFT